MMNGINKVILVGTLGKDPEVRYSSNGNAIANFSVATNESWKDKNTGQKVDKTEWHNIVMFGKVAEIAGEYLRKGSQVYLEGKVKTEKYQDRTTGEDRYSTKIECRDMQMLGGNGRDASPQNAQAPQQNHGGFHQPPQGGYQQAPQQNHGGFHQPPQGGYQQAPQGTQGYGQGGPQAHPNQSGGVPQNNEPPF